MLRYSSDTVTVLTKGTFHVASAFLLAWLLFGCTTSHLPPTGQDARTIAIAAVGDTNGYNTMQRGGQLQSIGELLSNRDLFIFNAEGVFSEELHFEDCHRLRNQSLFLGSSDIIDALPMGKVTIASLANNHVLDCGRQGLLETIQELKKRGITTVGAGDNVEQACKPLTLGIKGMNLAVLSYLEMDPEVLVYIGVDPDRLLADRGKGGVASWRLCNGQKQIADIRKEADIIIVLVHMHDTKYSWTDTTSTSRILFFQNILDAGADIVIGSGTHVPQGIIRSDKGVALLSLGNFLLRPDYNMPEEGHRSMVADFIISNDSLRLAIVPLRLDILGIPRIALKGDAGVILRRIVALSDQLGTTLQMSGERGYIEMQRVPNDGSPATILYSRER